MSSLFLMAMETIEIHLCFLKYHTIVQVFEGLEIVLRNFGRASFMLLFK